jgi:hypothetical protein
MKLGFPIPHLMRLKATRQPWEAAVTGAEQARLAKWADTLGYAMISVPEHFAGVRGPVRVVQGHRLRAQASTAAAPSDLVRRRRGPGPAARRAVRARPGMSKQEIVDRLGWLSGLGVTLSSVPVPPVSGIQEHMDYTQWVAEEIMPAVAG